MLVESSLRYGKNHAFLVIEPLYDLMIKKNTLITISVIDADKVHVLGTPDDCRLS